MEENERSLRGTLGGVAEAGVSLTSFSRAYNATSRVLISQYIGKNGV
jgi:hypothetical protein